MANYNDICDYDCVYPKKHNKESSKKMNSVIAWDFLIGDINKLNGKEDN